MGGVSFDQNCYAGDSTARYIAESLTFPHISKKRKVFVFTGAPCYSGNYFCRIPTGQNPKVMQLGQIFIIVPDTIKQDGHFVQSSLPKIKSQGQCQIGNLLTPCPNLVQSESQAPLSFSTAMLVISNLNIRSFPLCFHDFM